MIDISQYINERLIISKTNNPKNEITFKDLCRMKMHDFNDYAYGDNWDGKDWYTEKNIYRGNIRPTKYKNAPKFKNILNRELEHILPELSKLYKENEYTVLYLNKIIESESETEYYFKFEIGDFEFAWQIRKNIVKIYVK
jgi:CRISPR/Cas system-associated protein Cas5 (RAMP superfamily)